MNSLVTALKIGGVFSLGILTGVHINFSSDTIKSILSLASAPQAQRAFTTSLGLLRSTVRPLEAIATTALTMAWVFSPNHRRHPYLWIASTPVLISITIEKLKLSGLEYGVMSTQTVRAEGGRNLMDGEIEVNGEIVRGGMEKWRKWSLIRGVIIGTGFVLSLVGLYGDTTT